MIFFHNILYFGDDKGLVVKYELEEQEIIKKNNKKIHQYNISTIEYDYIYDEDLKQNIFILLTGSNDTTIKINYI